MLVNTQIAYILHKRPYRETSQILDVFTRAYGRISLLSKGSRSPKAKISGVLQLFRPLVISWQGRGELALLRSVDMADIRPPKLVAKSLLSAMYTNELLVYLLHRNDIHENVFDYYHTCLYSLQETADIELVLRLFEKNLLKALGFGLNLAIDADNGQPIESDRYYVYHFEHGPVQCAGSRSSTSNPVLLGESLLAFEQNKLDSSQQCAQIKSLMRYVLRHHLGGKQLRSRELFRSKSTAAAQSPKIPGAF